MITAVTTWPGLALGIAGSGLWATALYLGFYPLGQQLIDRLVPWLARSHSDSSQADFWAAIVSIVPFIILGAGLFYGITLTLGQSWAVSFGLMATVGGGVYELGRRDGEINRE